MSSEPSPQPAPFEFAGEPRLGEPKPRRRIGTIVTITLLSLALSAAITGLAIFFVQLDIANTRIEEQNRKLEQQKELIDKKETFGAAMQTLLSTTKQFDGVLMANLVDFDSYESFASRAWTHRWDATALDRDTEHVTVATKGLEDLLAGATAQAASNGTGSTYESVIDNLGRGFVASTLDDADSFCEGDVLACVGSEDPYTVHFDAPDSSLPYMTDWLKTGVAYHEFAHVLQFTNPGPTTAAVTAFGGDVETMADCFALTYLEGWTLDHRIWVSSYEYYDVNIGYGYTCGDTQKQAIRDWYGTLGFTSRAISQ